MTDRESPTSPAPPPDAELVSALDEFEAALQRHGFTAEGTKAGAALEDARRIADHGDGLYEIDTTTRLAGEELVEGLGAAGRELEPAGEYECAACDGHIVIVAGEPLVACTDCVLRLRMLGAAAVITGLDAKHDAALASVNRAFEKIHCAEEWAQKSARGGEGRVQAGVLAREANRAAFDALNDAHDLIVDLLPATMVKNRSDPDHESTLPASAENKPAVDRKSPPLLDQCRAYAELASWSGIATNSIVACSLAKGHAGAHQVVVRVDEWIEP